MSDEWRCYGESRRERVGNRKDKHPGAIQIGYQKVEETGASDQTCETGSESDKKVRVKCSGKWEDGQTIGTQFIPQRSVSCDIRPRAINATSSAPTTAVVVSIFRVCLVWSCPTKYDGYQDAFS